MSAAAQRTLGRRTHFRQPIIDGCGCRARRRYTFFIQHDSTEQARGSPAREATMKVILAGGTGQVGTLLGRALTAGGHEVVAFSRHPRPAPWRVVAWDAETLGPWAAELDGADVVIGLAGRNVNCRYTPQHRRRSLGARVHSTRVLGSAIARAARPPRAWLQASTATIYAHRFDAPNDEATGLLGGDEPNAPDTWRFSIQVAKAWEAAAREASLPRTRLVLMRSALTLGPDPGGIFSVLLSLVRLGAGGAVAGGRQYVSWIHEQDFVRSVLWVVWPPEMDGPVNLASPNPLPQAEFMRVLRQAWGMPIGLPATAWMAAIGALVLGTETELILKSRRVVPGRMLAAGFAFQFPSWPEAARDLCARWRRQA